MSLKEDKFVDFKGENDHSHCDGRDGKSYDLVAPSKQPDRVDVGDHYDGCVNDTSHSDDEERSDQDFEAILASRIEVRFAQEIAIEHPCCLEAVKSAHCRDDAILASVLVFPMVERFVSDQPMDSDQCHEIEKVQDEEGERVHA